ncbi:hypothetical protein F4811DRAFT_559118 [Daldinia bambusicola]|nr:hypothetical protein F4811DRAFT_559118 [Daldinia bambusicola]
MRPVKITDFSQGSLTEASLLLLSTDRQGIQYLAHLLARNGTDNGIRSKEGGVKLPNEIWLMILAFARKGTKDRFRLVKAEQQQQQQQQQREGSSASPDTMLLRCTRHEFVPPEDDEYLLAAANLVDKDSVRDFERYLECSSSSTAAELGSKIPELRKLTGPENTFEVVLDGSNKNPCLYGFLDVPDFIARLEEGECWVCDGSRFICPGCTGGVASRFDAFMGCGVDLACPLCMGLEFSQSHKFFLETYYYEPPDDSQRQDTLEWIEDRLKELGYGDVAVEERACGNAE